MPRFVATILNVPHKSLAATDTCGETEPGCGNIPAASQNDHEQPSDLYAGFDRPSQLSCLDSSVGKNIALKADGRGFESHPRQPKK